MPGSGVIPMSLFILWLVIVLILSVIPVPEVGILSLSLLPVDKIVHFALYGVTAILLCRILRTRYGAKRSVLYSIAVPAFYGALLEGVQFFIPYRGFSTADMAVNTLGAAVFAGFYFLTYH
jgi:VanZ family protein